MHLCNQSGGRIVVFDPEPVAMSTTFCKRLLQRKLDLIVSAALRHRRVLPWLPVRNYSDSHQSKHNHTIKSTAVKTREFLRTYNFRC